MSQPTTPSPGDAGPTGPAPYGQEVADIVARLNAPGGYDAFAATVRAARCCRRPVRLQGRITTIDPAGRRRTVFDSRQLPDGVLLKACGTRRETLCPPCASIYRGDAFALVAAGLRGGKQVPDTITDHPAVLLTLTAPSFGPVHRQRPDGTCHPAGRRCPHRRLICGRRHHDDDPQLGEALCPACYDYQGAVLFNARISELWRRTAIYGLRTLGNLAGLSVRHATRTLRLSYVKVVEFQRRGSVHVHALIRLDRRGHEHGPPPAGIDAAMLAAALRIAAAKVTAPVPGHPDLRVSWGGQTDVAVITDTANGRARAAAYAAKYACKSTDHTGALDRRLHAGIPDRLNVPPHLRRLVETAWTLGADPTYQALRLRLWAHTCGMRGHFLTKSRRYSTTFHTLRAERQAWQVAHRRADQPPNITPDDGEAVVREWQFAGVGYTTLGDAILAEELADQDRLSRRAAWKDRQSTSATAEDALMTAAGKRA